MRTSPTQLLTLSYSFVKRTGFLETSIGSHLFTSAYFFYKRHIEDNLQDLLRARPHLLRNGHVLDIGANVGYTATVLANETCADQLVYAFEPEPDNFAMLQRVAVRPKVKDRIVTLRCAVGAEDRPAKLWINTHHHGDHRVITDHFRESASPASGISVPMISIDTFIEQHPGPVGFVKIDVQGFELPVCSGMVKTLAQNPDVTIVLEYAPASMEELGINPSDLLRFLEARGFACYLVGSKGRLSPIAQPTVEREGYVDLLFSRRPSTWVESG
jgi:FkbM family methyltransferase